MDKIGYDTKYVNKNTRAGRDGKQIICPQCDKSATVYHFSWSALECNGCHSAVEKNAWIVKQEEVKIKVNYVSMRDRLQSVFDEDDIFSYSDELLDELTEAVLEELTNKGDK